MRLFLSAVGIIVAFGFGAWVIARLLADSVPQWVGLTLSMVWLFLLILGAVQLGSKERGSIRGDQSRLLAYGLLAAALMALFLVPLFIYHANIPRWAAEAILGVIAGAVFLLSKYMEHRRNQRSIS